MKDCFGLHGHSASGSVANKISGVGRKSAASGVHTTDLVHWLQAGKTADIIRCASESTDLLPPSALPRLLRSLRLSRPPALRDADYRLPPVIVLPLWSFVFIEVVVLMVVEVFNQKGSANMSVVLLFAVLYYMGDRQSAYLLYALLIPLGIMRLLMIPA